VVSIVALAARANPGIAAMVLDEGNLRRSLMVFRGEEQLDGDAVIEDDCEITLMTPIAGGALDEDERLVYSWQLDVAGFGEAGQQRLKNATVLISRVGGVGGAVATQLAAAGVGRLILAHAGEVRADDLNRQTLMTHAAIGRPRIEVASARLRELNPRIEVVAFNENVTEGNADRLMGMADLAVGCAPLFEERLALNRAAVRQGKPLVDCAMYEMEGQVLTVRPGPSACLECIYPEAPVAWRRRFPVFGAVAGAVGCLGAVEAIKLLAGLGEPLEGRLLLCDLAAMRFRCVAVRRRPECGTCGGRG
jgi:molybdopterin/thiamine biosynthesis adenylyltransferase